MAELGIATADNRATFSPGEQVQGTCGWWLDRAPSAIEMRLFWYTEGKGTKDVDVVDTIRFESPAAQNRREFSFTLPSGPYSFSGKLISLIWALELVVQPSGEAKRVQLTVSPSGEEIVLSPVDSQAE